MIRRLVNTCSKANRTLQSGFKDTVAVKGLTLKHFGAYKIGKSTIFCRSAIARGFAIKKNSDKIYDMSDFVQDFPQIYTDGLAEIEESKKHQDQMFTAFGVLCEAAVLVNIQKRKHFLRAHRETRMDFLREGDMLTYDDIIAKSCSTVEGRFKGDVEAALRLYDMDVASNMKLIFGCTNQEEIIDKISIYFANLEFEQTKTEHEKAMSFTNEQVIESCARMLKELESYDYVAKDLEHDNIIRITYLNDMMEEKGWVTFDQLPKESYHLSPEAAAAVDLLISKVWLSDEDYSHEILVSRQ